MTSKRLTYFKILGIQPTTDKSVIKKAYRKKAFQYHPDRNKLPSAHEKFIQLTEAYEGLIEGPKKNNASTRFYQKTTEEVLAERMRAARERYRQAQKKEVEEDQAFYDRLTSKKLGIYFKWFGYVAAFLSLIWILDYILNPNSMYVVVEEYLWTGPEICFDIGSKNYCFDSRQAAGIGKHGEINAFFSPILGDLKYVITKDYVGDLFEIYPYRTFSYCFPYVPILMLLPFFTWRFREPAPWFVFLYFVGYVIVGSMVLFRVVSLFF